MRSRIRLLAVDDDRDILRNLALMLSFEDYHVVTASSGVEAISLLNQFSFDAVITSLRMPVIDGFEVVRRIHAIRPDTPVIVTSYDFDEKSKEWIRQNGICSLEKPYNVRQLSDILRSFNFGQMEQKSAPAL